MGTSLLLTMHSLGREPQSFSSNFSERYTHAGWMQHHPGDLQATWVGYLPTATCRSRPPAIGQRDRPARSECSPLCAANRPNEGEPYPQHPVTWPPAEGQRRQRCGVPTSGPRDVLPAHPIGQDRHRTPRPARSCPLRPCADRVAGR
jgi:hypothetical protein